MRAIYCFSEKTCYFYDLDRKLCYNMYECGFGSCFFTKTINGSHSQTKQARYLIFSMDTYLGLVSIVTENFSPDLTSSAKYNKGLKSDKVELQTSKIR